MSPPILSRQTWSAARRAGRLPRASWLALARVVPAIVAVRLALWVLPYRVAARLFDADPSRRVAGPPARAAATLRVAAWAGRALVSDRPCLTQALAARWLLARDGHASVLRLGVRRAGTGIEAHAWLELDGRVVLGGSDSVALYRSFEPAASTPAASAAAHS